MQNEIKNLQTRQMDWKHQHTSIPERIFKDCGKNKGGVDVMETIAVRFALKSVVVPYGVSTLCYLLL